MKENRLQTNMVLIPNGTGPSNIGDLAMLEVLEGLIKKYVPRSKIVIHTTEPERHRKLGRQAKHSLYSYVAFKERGFFYRIFCLTKLLFLYFVFNIKAEDLLEKYLINDELYKLCKDYKDAKTIIFVGGGYLRTQPFFTQSINLIMQLLMVAFSKLFQNKIIVSPISFGPFAYAWQERLSARVLNGIDAIFARENISYELLKRNNVKNVHLSIDHALFLGQGYKPKNKKHLKILGFTLRQWFDFDRQIKFEQEIAAAISKFATNNNLIVQPILQVDSPAFGDKDEEVSYRVVNSLKNFGVKTRSLKKVKNLRSALKIYGDVDLLVGMRMHSNILAATVGTPFVAIAYEHKTEGITETIKMNRYCIKAEEVNSTNLHTLLVNQSRNLNLHSLTMTKNLNSVVKVEKNKWADILLKSN